MNNTSRDALLMAVNQAGFAVTEANLYLDTHPCDSQAIAYLKQMSQLNSNSIFAEIDAKITDRKVTADDIMRVSDELTLEIKEYLKKNSRMVRRAIMANTIDKLPVFFNSPQEVADYVTMSLEQCDDEAEKYASKQLVMEMMF